MTPAYAERQVVVELNHLNARATHLFDQTGAAKPTVAARYIKLWQNARFLYPDADTGPRQGPGDCSSPSRRPAPCLIIVYSTETP
jgi:hypothetical protein